MNTAGFFGKLPSHGDFVSRRLSSDFLRKWDEWLQRCVAESRTALGDSWLDTYLTSPIWRFAMTPGVCGPEAKLGLLMPSVDRVGRYFPLSIVTPVVEGSSALVIAMSSHRWFEAGEQILLSVLSDSAPTLESFDQQVTELSEMLADTETAMPDGMRRDRSGSRWELEVPGDRPIEFAVASLADDILVDLVGSMSWWWTPSSAGSPARYLAARGLPEPESYASMLGETGSPVIPKNWQHDRENSDREVRSRTEVAKEPLPLDKTHSDSDVREVLRSEPAERRVDDSSLAALINEQPNLSYESSSRTEVGKVRRENEDSVLDDVGRGVWVVADGMGGHAAGKTASTAIISALSNSELPDELDHAIEAITQALHAVNRELRAYGRHRRDCDGLGSTVAVLVARETNAAILWVGDSRVYRKRGEHFDQLTIDHSEHQERLERGDITTILGPGNHAVTRAIGGEDTLRISTIRQGLQSGDRFLICSDGVYQEIPLFELAELIADGSVEIACNAIVDAVLEGRAQDNASAIVVDVHASWTTQN